MTDIREKIKKGKSFFSPIAIFILFAVFFPALIVYAANVFNSSSSDYPLRVGNYTQSGGTQNWQTTLNGVNPGDELRFSVYYHNAGGQSALNTLVKLQLSPTGSSTSFTATETISATGFTSYVSSAKINIVNSKSITFKSTASWYHNYNGSTYQITEVPVIVSGSTVVYTLGTVKQGYAPNDGYVIFTGYVSPLANAGPDQTVNAGKTVTLNGSGSVGAKSYSWSCTGGSLSNSKISNPVFTAPNVSSKTTYVCTLTVANTIGVTATDTVNIIVNPVATPVVSAGANKTILSGQSTTLEGTASHPSGLSMTYKWTCTGGTLSSTTTLRPTYKAPVVSSTTKYTCTLVATDSNGKTASSSMYVTVNPTSGPVVSAGSNKTVSSGKTVTLDGTASHPNGLVMTYKWTCTGGSLSSSTILKPTYTAPSVTTSRSYTCTLTATDSNGKSASSTVTITVNPVAVPVVDAGPDKTLISGQSVILEGTASHPSGLSMTYKWTCTGGTLSSTTTLRPTYKAPVVSSTTKYTCTLVATDSNGKTASSSMYVTVNPTSGPVVSAGSNKTVSSGKTVTLDGTASHPNGLVMTYKWTCTGGSLSSSTILKPTYTAPSVTTSRSYTCTLTATDSNGKSASSTVTITVNPVAVPVVDAGPDKTLISGQSVILEGTASHPSGLSMTYKWTCTGGTLSSTTTLRPTYKAPVVSSTTKYTCTLVATDSNGKTASSSMYVTVNPTSGPVVSAGSNKTILSGQSTSLNGSASHPNGLSMTYSWSCSGGSISNSSLLQPTFYAPYVTSTIAYSCTLIATDSNGKSASSTVTITVNPVATSNPVVSAGPSKSIQSSQSTTLEGSASHPNGLSMTYSWSCSGGSISNSSLLQPTFYAPAVSSTVTYSCTLTATDTNNNSASSITYITVSPASTSNPVVSAGPSKSIQSSQSTTLEGSASHPNGLSMTYSWSCSGGSISNSSLLQPIFYAPYVTSTVTYSCTLTGTDTNNNSASSITYITVTPSSYYYSSPVINAGPSKTVLSGQSTTLEGTASHPNGLSINYYWSCNGGSLSNQYTLQPTFYAPTVSSTMTYSCTLTGTDTSNNSASSITYITVSSSYTPYELKV
ncbi:MAG: PKD domain-containing protein, partial [Candidatus Paceibacterota bacterium]